MRAESVMETRLPSCAAAVAAARRAELLTELRLRLPEIARIIYEPSPSIVGRTDESRVAMVVARAVECVDADALLSATANETAIAARVRIRTGFHDTPLQLVGRC